jgi:hypothetical protein
MILGVKSAEETNWKEAFGVHFKEFQNWSSGTQKSDSKLVSGFEPGTSPFKAGALRLHLRARLCVCSEHIHIFF